MAQPELLVNSLLLRVIESYRSDEVPDFTLARYEEDAKKIGKHDPRNGEMMLGLIAGLRHDAAAVHQHYQAAVAMGDVFYIHCNFVNAFYHAYDYQAARESVKASFRLMNRTDPSDLDKVSTMVFAYGMLDEAISLQQRLSKIKGAEFDSRFLKKIEVLKDEAVPHLQELLMAVYGALSKYKLIMVARVITRIPLSDDGSFFTEYVISVLGSSAEKLAQCQQEADEAVVAYEETHHLEPTPIGFRLTRGISA